MKLVEVGPIIREVSSAYRVRARALRESARDPELKVARTEAMQRLRDEGLSLRSIAALMHADHTHVGNVTSGPSNKGRLSPQPAKQCSRCFELKPLEAYARKAESADGCQSHCRLCNRAVDRAYRDRAFQRRANGEDRWNMHVRLHVKVHDLLKDTAERHGVTMASIIERAVTKALACKDCGKRLRQEGSDYCAACDAVWAPEVIVREVAS